MIYFLNYLIILFLVDLKNCVHMHAHYKNRVEDKKQQRKGKRKKDTRTQTTMEAASPGVRFWEKME